MEFEFWALEQKQGNHKGLPLPKWVVGVALVATRLLAASHTATFDFPARVEAHPKPCPLSPVPHNL